MTALRREDSDDWYIKAVVGAFQLVEIKENILAIAKGLSSDA